MTAAVQLGLFDDQVVEQRVEWAAHFERATWTAPYDCPLGPAGTEVLGWRCPCCGDVEVNACLLMINHGFDPDSPGRGGDPDSDECAAQMLRSAHAAYDQRAADAAAMCASAGHTNRPGRRHLNPAQEHGARRRIGRIACGQCWEDAIRADALGGAA